MANAHERKKNDREVLRILRKLSGGLSNPTIPTPTPAAVPNWRWDYTLTLMLGAVSLAFVIFPPQEPITLFVWLSVMFGLAIYPVLHLTNWIFGSRLIAYMGGIATLAILTALIGYERFPPPNSEVHISQEGTLFIENKTAKLNVGFVNEHPSEVAVRTVSLFMVTGPLTSADEQQKVEEKYWGQLRTKFEQMKAVSKTYSFEIEPRVPKWTTLAPEQPNLTDREVQSLTTADAQTSVFFMTIVNYGADLGEFESCVITQGVGKPIVNCRSGHNRPVRPTRRHWWSV